MLAHFKLNDEQNKAQKVSFLSFICIIFELQILWATHQANITN